MQITISISTNNAAFADHPVSELDRILSTIPAKFSDLRSNYPATASVERKLLDSNGNTCGTITLTL